MILLSRYQNLGMYTTFGTILSIDFSEEKR